MSGVIMSILLFATPATTVPVCHEFHGAASVDAAQTLFTGVEDLLLQRRPEARVLAYALPCRQAYRARWTARCRLPRGSGVHNRARLWYAGSIRPTRDDVLQCVEDGGQWSVR